ncbi:MAG TPA: flagellar biosynthesis protein FlhF [Pirellulales bacterium]|nr:flagellar biosynthesis protein FlhF [Pirellulales bacterium]
MDVKTYRARTMQEALALVRRDLGPSAAVLHTREVRGNGLLGWLSGSRQIEVMASTEVNVPSRLAKREPAEAVVTSAPAVETAPGLEWAAKSMFRDELKGQLNELHSLVEDLCRRTRYAPQNDWSDGMFRLYTDLIDAEISEDLARELIDRLRCEAPGGEIDDPTLAKSRLVRMVEDEIAVAGPIQVAPGRCRLAALVGPTGVGKTTTIAKLAANFRLREKRRVGLITVDTYRIAAVEQLRTYAEIIDLPMQVVSTPGEMREAVDRMADLDLVLLDTAGRSPQDEIKLQELKAFLGEADADEVHLVLSSVSSASALTRTAQRFSGVGATSLILTKLDEAAGLGNLLPLLRSCKLPLSYLTHGQNVPDDIAPAERRRLARSMLAL